MYKRGSMLEICFISYLVVSIPVTILLLLAFTVAKRADSSLEGTDKVYPYQLPGDEKVHFKGSIPSVDY